VHVSIDTSCDDVRFVWFTHDFKLEAQLKVDISVDGLVITREWERATFAVAQGEFDVRHLPMFDVDLVIL
jgi:hypothetical protein